MAIKEAECNMTVESSMSSIWTATHGHTGRAVRGNEGYALATDWARLENHSELLGHTARAEFCRLLPSAPRLSDAALVFFRGRGITGRSPCFDQMGPPPLGSDIDGGRYNYPGECALYLSDSKEGVLRELSAWYVEGAPYVQRYRLPLDRLRIADFTTLPDDHFVAAVFSKAEGCNVDGRGSNSYIFSQLVAELVKAHFDGMRVPGVRGNRGSWYSNVVVFQPHPEWCAWLEHDSAPCRLSDPPQEAGPE